MDRDHLAYCLNEIQSRKGTPYRMANEKLADELFPHIQATFPDAIMIKYFRAQYIVVTKRARTALIKLLAAEKVRYENYIVEVEKTLNQLV